jgi:pyrroline-5-carboxylate reductase
MKILLVGCGKMGSAMMNGWKKAGLKDIKIVDPALGKEFSALPKDYQPDYVVIAVKPQSFGDTLPALKEFSKAVSISIAAGKTIKSIQRFLPQSAVVRTMPNLPAIIGQGITAAFTSAKLSGATKADVEKILKANGKLAWVKKEADLDAVTAISGSGPAYVFLFADALVEAGVELGLSKELSKELALQTIKGSVELAEAAKEDLLTLKQNVTSKGGTTEAALKVFESKDVLRALVKKAAKAAQKRAKELSS